MERLCKECNTILKGRIDKKFCDDTCRNLFNNRANADSSAYMKRVNNTLRKNRHILAGFNPDGKNRISKIKLLEAGFQFDFFTSIYKNKEGKTYYFCYEQGYMLLEHDMYFLVVKKTID